jgi:hypothetical protein
MSHDDPHCGTASWVKMFAEREIVMGLECFRG